uniref:Uncharacterized protein n=1 Tax=Romanomermis culicivorax TaxID=13658 RepID=A0A915J2H6_ROMCU
MKKKKKKQKDEWNKWPEVSYKEDPSLQPKLLYEDAKRLQAALASAMKSSLTHHLMELLGFPVSPIYKLAIHNRITFKNDLLLPTEVDDVWIEHVATDQPLRDPTYHGTHYRYLPNTIISLLQVGGEWLWHLTTTMPLAAVLGSPCSPGEFAYINDMFARHTQSLNMATGTAFYACMW